MRRLYYIFPNVEHTKKVVDELLVARIPIGHMHVVARRGTALNDLPEASVFQRTDVRRSLLYGLVAGLGVGVITGLWAHSQLDLPIGGLMLATGLAGMVLGAWAASMMGLMLHNSELKDFAPAIKDGKLLLMVDVPKPRIDEIGALVKASHPEADFEGVEPTIPSFP